MKTQLDPSLLRPLAIYERLYDTAPRRFAIPDAAGGATWDAWRAGLTAAVRERIGGLPATRTPLNVRSEAVTRHDGYRREYLLFESAPGVAVPTWLLIPDGVSGPAPAVVAIHGHGYGVDDIVGIRMDGSDRDAPEGYHKDFAVALCRRGFVVIAPEMLSFGRRRDPKEQAKEPGRSSCGDPAWWGIMLGKPLIGLRVWDVIRAIDLLETRPEVDPERIGIMGISGGGMVTLFTAVLEARLRAMVISGYLCTFRDSLLAIDHCACNYVPGLLQDAEMYDIAALLAPRPLLIEAGTQDDIFPLAAVQRAYEQVRAAYAALGAPDNIDQDIFEGGHQISGARAYDFLARRLGL